MEPNGAIEHDGSELSTTLETGYEINCYALCVITPDDRSEILDVAEARVDIRHPE